MWVKPASKEEGNMNLISIREIFRNRDKYIGSDITVGGWVRSVRDSKTFGFMVISDGTFSRHFR